MMRKRFPNNKPSGVLVRFRPTYIMNAELGSGVNPAT